MRDNNPRKSFNAMQVVSLRNHSSICISWKKYKLWACNVEVRTLLKLEMMSTIWKI